MTTWPAHLGKLATITTATAPTLGKHNSYSAANGALAPVLPPLTGGAVATALAAGQLVRTKISRSKSDTTTNLVTVTCTSGDTFEGGSSTLILAVPGEKVTISAQTIPGASGPVWVVEEHTVPRDALDQRYILPRTTAPSAADRTAGVLAYLDIAANPPVLRIWNGAIWAAATSVPGGNYLYRRGVNLAGAEFGGTLPGTAGQDYAYESAANIAWTVARGHKIFRVPFKWERIQPTRGAALDTSELGRLAAVVQAAGDAGAACILDVHNYARYKTGSTELLLNSTLPVSDLVDLWTRLATYFKGKSGVYAYGLMNEPHDLNQVFGTLTGTTRYDWNDNTVQGWSSSGVTAANGVLTISQASSGSAGFQAVGKDDGGTKRGGTVAGANVLKATVTKRAGFTGAWSAKLRWVNSSYQYQEANSTVMFRTDTGAQVGTLPDGVPVEVRSTFTAGIDTGALSYGIQFQANDAPASGTFVFDMDDFVQGTVSGAKTASKVWEEASQTVLTAIRQVDAATKIMVPGYAYSGAQAWPDNHPTPWITDPNSNFAYEAHYYPDSNNSGQFSGSYASEVTYATNNGFSSYADRATKNLNKWLNWLSTNNVKGYLGEFGWPHGTDASNWNALGEVIYGLLDAAKVDGTYWAAGSLWDSSYPLAIYRGQTVYAQSTTVEAHPSVTG